MFWLGALAIGIASAGFAKLADLAQHLFTHAAGRQDGWRFLPLLVTPLGFGVCALVAARFVPGSQGSGIPQAIAARHLRDDAERSGFLSLRIAAGKIVMTVFGLLCGASIGREGPTVQVGGVAPVLWTPLKSFSGVSDAAFSSCLSAGVPAADGRVGPIRANA